VRRTYDKVSSTGLTLSVEDLKENIIHNVKSKLEKTREILIEIFSDLVVAYYILHILSNFFYYESRDIRALRNNIEDHNLNFHICRSLVFVVRVEIRVFNLLNGTRYKIITELMIIIFETCFYSTTRAEFTVYYFNPLIQVIRFEYLNKYNSERLPLPQKSRSCVKM